MTINQRMALIQRGSAYQWKALEKLGTKYMEQKIKKIVEAFSMQPEHLIVCTRKTDECVFDRTETQHEHNKDCIKEIKLEYDGATQENYYIGYDSDGKKMFAYLQSSVNVHYQT